MDVSRRWFIGGAASLFLGRPGRIFADETGAFSQGRPELSFGVLSDVHISLDKGGKSFRKYHGVETLVAAFEWFRDNGADAVVIAGDMAHCGLAGELKAVADAWFKVFPGDKAPDGRAVARVFVFGNHDWTSPGRAAEVFPDEAERRANLLCADPQKWWEEIFHEAWTPFMLKEVRGYSFVGAHWCKGEHGCKGRDEDFSSGMKEFYAGRTFDPARPFFHIQHPQPKGTAHGDKVWGQDDGTSTAALSAFPNAIAFSGHSHTSLLDERFIWQGAFTSVGCGSLRNVNPGMPGVFTPKGGLENYKSPKDKQEFRRYEALKAMKVLNTYDCRQGQLVRVFKDRVTFARREFVTGAALGPDLVMPLSGDRPFAFAPRLARAQAPAFPAGAAVKVKKGKGRTRAGKRSEKLEVWNLSFPPANARAGAVPTNYEIRAKGPDGKDVSFGLAGHGSRFGAADARTRKPLAFRVRCDRVAEKPEFRVFAHSCWGKCSEPLKESAGSVEGKGA